MSEFVQKSGCGKYDLTRGTDGVVYCTCRGWKFSKSTPKACRHTKAYLVSRPATEHHFFVQRDPRSNSAIAIYKREVDTSNVERFFFGQWLRVLRDPIQSRATLGMLGPKHIDDALANGRLYSAGTTASDPSSKWAFVLNKSGVRQHYTAKPGGDLTFHVEVFISPKDILSARSGDWENVEMRAMCVTNHGWATGSRILIVESGELLHKPFGMYVANPKVQFFANANAARRATQGCLNELSDQLASDGPPLHVKIPITGEPISEGVSTWLSDRDRAAAEEERRRSEAVQKRATELGRAPVASLSEEDFAERMRAKRAAREAKGVSNG